MYMVTILWVVYMLGLDIAMLKYMQITHVLLYGLFY